MFDDREPTLDEIERIPGGVMLEFGAGWCGHCRALRPHVDGELRRLPQIRHLQIEDGKGQPLGRSFGVKLWPTLVFLHNGHIVDRLVRPAPVELRAAMARLAALSSPSPNTVDP